MRRSTATVLLTSITAFLSACGAAMTSTTTTNTAALTDGQPLLDPLSLVATDAGLAGVPVGTSTPRWVVLGAVAAPDGSAVFTLRDRDLLRIDPRTGGQQVVGTVEAPPSAHVAAVEPAGGARVAIAAPHPSGDGGTTLVIDFDTVGGEERSRRSFEGTVEPEAYSLDRRSLFAARTFGDRYHVHILDLATGQQRPTLGPDKNRPPEDMYGSVVQAALSPDGNQLATLYRDDTSPGHTAFVHLLSLADGTTVCIDLHDPFGSGRPGSDVIAWRQHARGDLILVGHRQRGAGTATTAAFDPKTVNAPDAPEHFHADIRADLSPPRLPAGAADAAGFRRFVALAT